MCYYVLHTRDSSYWREKEGMEGTQQQRELGMRRRITLSARILYQVRGIVVVCVCVCILYIG